MTVTSTAFVLIMAKCVNINSSARGHIQERLLNREGLLTKVLRTFFSEDI